MQLIWAASMNRKAKEKNLRQSQECAYFSRTWTIQKMIQLRALSKLKSGNTTPSWSIPTFVHLICQTHNSSGVRNISQKKKLNHDLAINLRSLHQCQERPK